MHRRFSIVTRRRSIFKVLTLVAEGEGIIKHGERGKSAYADNDRRKLKVPIKFCGQEISLEQLR